MRARSNSFHTALLAAVMAATLQVLLWAGGLSAAFGPAALASPSVSQTHYCGEDAPHTAPNDQQPHHAACLLCPFCLAHALPISLPPPPPAPAPARLAGRADIAPRDATFLPPQLPQAAAFPRGPPLT